MSSGRTYLGEIRAGGALQRLWRFRRYGRPYVPVLVVGVGLRIAELLADLAQPWLLAVIVDSVLGHRPLGGPLAAALGRFAGSEMALLTAAVVGFLVLVAIGGALDYLGDRVMNGAGERITAAIRADLFAHLQRLPLAFHDRRRVGELANRVSSDTGRIEDALVDVFSTLLPSLFTIGGLLLALVVVVDWRLGVVTVSSAPLVLLTFSRYMRLIRGVAGTRRAREGELTGQVVEALSGIRTIHALGRHEVHDRSFAEANELTLAAGLQEIELRARFTPLVEACLAVGTALLLWVGAWGVLRGLWTLGVLLVVISYGRNLVKPIRSLTKLSAVLSRAAASAERVGAVLDEPLPAFSGLRGPPDVSPRRARGEIELRNVTFSYGRERVLNRIWLEVDPGERVAVLGPNGAGKSSLLALIARLYDPQGGTIVLDGMPIDRLPLHWLREQLAVVLQDTFLFGGSLRDNIVYGRPSASPQEILEAAGRALVTEFARDLPQGFDTLLGDRGVGLSGGQRQRVAIARALLRNAPIVLMDEPTSGLDLEAERVVVEALRSLMEGCTVLMATHRPALLDLATRVVSLEGGVLVPVGSAPASRNGSPAHGSFGVDGIEGQLLPALWTAAL